MARQPILHREGQRRFLPVRPGDSLCEGRQIGIQDQATGQINLLAFKGANLVGSLMLEGSGYWDVVGVGDFNNDGKDDYATQNNGQINFLFFEGTKLVASHLLDGTFWDVKGVGDYNHDGHADLVTRDAATGQINNLGFVGTTFTTSLRETQQCRAGTSSTPATSPTSSGISERRRDRVRAACHHRQVRSLPGDVKSAGLRRARALPMPSQP